MKFLKKIVLKTIKGLMLIKVIIKSKIYQNKIYLIGVPIHGNLGDQAITIAEEKFLKENFKKYKIIEIESVLAQKYIKFLKKIIKSNELILIHGGGFLGSLWLEEEMMFRKVLINFPNNNIIVFPQTIYFENVNVEDEIMKKSMEIYSSHKHLTICCREKYSYDFMKQYFKNVNTLLVPDMVLYLNNIKCENKRNDVLFCLRKDKEKVIYNLDKIKVFLEEKYQIFYTDTVIKKKVNSYNRKKVFLNKINEFSKYELVITDRLHGMIFALLAQTPCLVLENKSYKIKGVYEWIKDVCYIKLTKHENILKDLKEFINQDFNFSRSNISLKYEKLIKLISTSLGDAKDERK